MTVANSWAGCAHLFPSARTEEHPMRTILATAAAALALSTAVALAQPGFTDSDLVIIHRNAALSAIVDRNPALVRRVLDAIASAQADAMSRAGARSGRDARPKRYELTPDPARNPDLDQLDRSSPEAAHDLFQLIKQASKPSGKGADRSK
jgi:hypothetical protein